MRNTIIQSQENALIKEFSTVESKSYKDNDVRVIIKQGALIIDTGYLSTTNNLITYQWYVLPRTAKISLINTLKPISYFSNSGYDIRFLDLYLSNFITTTYNDQSTTTQSHQLLPLQTSLAAQFQVQCLLSPRITDFFCQQAFTNTINSIPLYNLKQDYIWLQQLYQSIDGTSYETHFCDAIKKYIFFSNDSNKEIKDIMVGCGKEYEDSIGDFISFRSIQDQLSTETISSTVTSSALLNTYKLLSTQHDIYYEINAGNNTINTNRIWWYNNYIEAILKDTDKIQPFYFDVIARFNNTILIPALIKASLTARGDIADDYKRLLDQLKKINQWDTIAGHSGLIWHIINPNLLQSGSLFALTGSTVSNIVDTFQQSYSYSNYIIKSSSAIDQKTVQTSGVLRFSDNKVLANNSPMNATFIYQDQRFFIKAIDLPRHPQIASVINPKLTIKPLPISEVYDLILQSAAGSVISQDVCTSFKNNGIMKSCSSQQAIFIQNKITYTFSYIQDKGVTSYTISDQTLERSAKDTYGTAITITSNPVDAIKLILGYHPTIDTAPPITTTTLTGGTKEIQIQKDFESIGAKVNKISDVKWYTLIEFILKNYTYTCIYDSTKKSIIWLAIMINGTTYPIRNFSFSFLNSSDEDRELLKNDPATFLLQKDPLTVKKLQLK